MLLDDKILFDRYHKLNKTTVETEKMLVHFILKPFGLYLPSEEESQQGTSQVQSFVAIMISVVLFSTSQGCQKQSVYHVATVKYKIFNI